MPCRHLTILELDWHNDTDNIYMSLSHCTSPFMSQSNKPNFSSRHREQVNWRNVKRIVSLQLLRRSLNMWYK